MRQTRSQMLMEQFSETIEETRARIYEDANPALRAELDWFQDWFDKEVRHTLQRRWELGNRYNKIYDDENSRKNRYGSNAVKKISDYFGWDEGTIYDAMRFAKQFTEDEVRQLAERRMSDGRLLSYSHMLAALTVDDPDERKGFIDRAVKEAWSAKQMFLEIRPHLKPKKPIADRRGRPLAIPRNFDAVLSQIESFVHDFVDRAEKVWQHEEHCLMAKMDDLLGEDFNEEHAKRIVLAARKLNDLAVKAKQLEEEMLKVHKVFVKGLASSKPALKMIGSVENKGSGK